jgi:ppGpp synthetase/RelA/SpoT-type nucleotidyltranferase
MNKSDINRLGDRLRQGNLTAQTLSELDAYRRSFQPAIAEVVSSFRNQMGSFPASLLVQRPSKSTPSILAKLSRLPSTNLTQIQDIAGLRLMLHDRLAQDVFVERVMGIFPEVKLIDRRISPSFGYRAVHLVIRSLDRNVEIQLRTALQHAWAHQSEMIADRIGHDFKYGNTPNEIYETMLVVSEQIHIFEIEEQEFLTAHGGIYHGSIFDQLNVRKRDLFRSVLNVDTSDSL